MVVKIDLKQSAVACIVLLASQTWLKAKVDSHLQAT